MLTEPDPSRHNIFATSEEAHASWEALTDELKERIAPPRQTHGGWIFDKE